MEVPFEEKDVDFKEMNLKMARAAEAAIQVLIEVQQECEEMYVSAMEPRLEDLRNALGNLDEDV